MRTIHGIAAAPEDTARIAALGVFDGVHLGHQAIIRRALDWAHRVGAVVEVITFDRHPRSVVGRGAPLPLTSLAHRLKLFAGLGVDQCRVLEFTPEMAGLSAHAFAQTVLAGAVGVVTGYDQRFGRNRRGGLADLQEAGRALGFEVLAVDPVTVKGQPVSSTAIREALTEGDLDGVRDMLGRPYGVYGTVVQGEGVGREIGFPTANLDLGDEATPPDGVYWTDAWLDGERLDSVSNVGRRPTFRRKGDGFQGSACVEVHLLDFQADLYGRAMEVSFLRKLRDEKPCRSRDELVDMIARDVAEVRRLIAQRAETGQSAGQER